EFRIQPTRDEYLSQTVAEVVGDGQVIFEDCVITQEETVKTPCAAVTVTELQDVMPMGPPRQREPPKIRFENCFVRGRGDGIWVRTSRQINLEVERSLFALDGSFLNVEGSKKVPPTPVSTVALKETTTYLTEHLLLLGSSREDPKKKEVVTTA